MSTALDQEFETGVRLIRDAYSKKLAAKETEVVQLHGDNARKDAEIKELRSRIAHLEQQLAKNDRRLQDAQKQAAKLQQFKQSIISSFTGEGLQLGDNSEFAEMRDRVLEQAVMSSPEQQQVSASYQQAPIYQQPQDTSYSAQYQQQRSQQQQRIPQPAQQQYGEYAQDDQGSPTPYRGREHRQEQQQQQQSRVYQTSPLRSNNFKDLLADEERRSVQDSTRSLQNVPQPQKAAAPSAPPLTATSVKPATIGYESPYGSIADIQPASKSSAARGSKMDLRQASAADNVGRTVSQEANTTVDGRDFFRRAKSVLSYDEFTQLLWNVKAYNARDQSRGRTLDAVHQAVYAKHPDVYAEFERLLQQR